MKAITVVLIILLALAPVALCEETFNPNTGEWEGGPDADEMIQDPYGERPLYRDPDIETLYDPYREPRDEQQPEDETWPDTQDYEWDQPQEEDEWSGGAQEDGSDQMDPSMLPEEGYSDGYGDEGFQEQRQEEPWSYSPEDRGSGGPPPFLRIPSNRR